MTFRRSWLTSPVLFFCGVLVLLAVWAVMDPATLVANFDNDGHSPFELATLPLYAAIVPFIWIFNPFGGSRVRRTLFALMASIVVVMAVVKETDLHNAALHRLYPEYVTEGGSLEKGKLFKNKYKPVEEKKAALVAACAKLKAAGGTVQMVEVAETDKHGVEDTVVYRVMLKDGKWLSAEGLSGTPFKMRGLTSPDVPVGMKALILLYFVLFFGLFGLGFLALFPTWLKGVFKLDATCWAWGCFGASGVMVQVFDRLPAWLDHADGLGAKSAEVVTRATSFCTCFEEGSELMIALFALLTIWLGHKALADSKKEQTA